jgi:hypothetical protein
MSHAKFVITFKNVHEYRLLVPCFSYLSLYDSNKRLDTDIIVIGMILYHLYAKTENTSLSKHNISVLHLQRFSIILSYDDDII